MRSNNNLFYVVDLLYYDIILTLPALYYVGIINNTKALK